MTSNNPDSKAPHCFPDALWAEMDGVDEVIIHNGRPDLEDLIATGYLRKYVLEPTPQQAAKVLLESSPLLWKIAARISNETSATQGPVDLALMRALKALAESKDD